MTPSRAARLATGRSAVSVARRCCITTRYLLRCESAQTFSPELARRLVRLYGTADYHDFLPQPDTRRGRETQSTRKPAGTRSRPAVEVR